MVFGASGLEAFERPTQRAGIIHPGLPILPEGVERPLHLPGDLISVYVPTTPNPTGGYFLLLPRAEVIELDMSVDEALTYVISMGAVSPTARPVPSEHSPAP